MVREIPGALLDGPFTARQAAEVGYPAAALRRQCWVRLFRGVHVHRDVELTPLTWVVAALLSVPARAAAVVTHRTAAWVHGLDVAGGSGPPWELSVRTAAVSAHADVRLHRRTGPIETTVARGVQVTTPERTVVDCAWRCSLVQVVQLVEHLCRTGRTTQHSLHRYLEHCHLDGVVAARRAMGLVRGGSESAMETALRLMLVLAGLPEPRTNVEVRGADGVLVARVDLLYPLHRVVVEYDGRHHETDRAQWAHDRRRREALEALGYRVIVVAALDLRQPHDVVRRVHRALVATGWRGERPWFSADWNAQFGKALAM